MIVAVRALELCSEIIGRRPLLVWLLALVVLVLIWWIDPSPGEAQP
ncbi:MAG: hypothetical protein JWO36_3003 [Myxococcales bacterium]|nr:hypothetical protein [Myxococcales bacterium]